MAKSKFNLAEKLGGVSNLNTPDMQVIQIPLSQLIVTNTTFSRSRMCRNSQTILRCMGCLIR